MAWWITIDEAVVRGVRSFGFEDPDLVLKTVEEYLSLAGTSLSDGRWDQCPDRFFIYSHLFLDRNKPQLLQFLQVLL